MVIMRCESLERGKTPVKSGSPQAEHDKSLLKAWIRTDGNPIRVKRVQRSTLAHQGICSLVRSAKPILDASSA